MLNIKKDTLVLDELPFCIGAQSTPNNPSSIPNRATLLLKYCAESTLISLEPSDELEKLLNSAYEYGFEMGIPSDSTELGGPYVKDFLKFIKANIKEKAEILEIGAGTGYLSKLLMEDGHEVDALEPGKGYAEAWAKHEIPVIQDFFPSSFLKKKYDVIIFYTVLEHIANLNEFFSHLTARMKPNAKVICAVPDCSLEINAGDPSMLLHEHMHYFTPNSLNWLLQKFFKDSYVCSSGVGRLIYGIAGNNGDISKVFKFSQNVFPDQYLRKVSGKINFAKNRIKSLKKFGSVGIFCPARALYFIHETQGLRFFDDADFLCGKFYPPFPIKIENRLSLKENPPEILIIFSYTYGREIRAAIRELFRDSEMSPMILTQEEFFDVSKNFP